MLQYAGITFVTGPTRLSSPLASNKKLNRHISPNVRDFLEILEGNDTNIRGSQRGLTFAGCVRAVWWLRGPPASGQLWFTSLVPLVVLPLCPFVLVLPSSLRLSVCLIWLLVFFVSTRTDSPTPLLTLTHPSRSPLQAAAGDRLPGRAQTSDCWRACWKPEPCPKSSQGPHTQRTARGNRAGGEPVRPCRDREALFLLLTGGTPQRPQHRPLFRWIRDTLQQH